MSRVSIGNDQAGAGKRQVLHRYPSNLEAQKDLSLGDPNGRLRKLGSILLLELPLSFCLLK